MRLVGESFAGCHSPMCPQLALIFLTGKAGGRVFSRWRDREKRKMEGWARLAKSSVGRCGRHTEQIVGRFCFCCRGACGRIYVSLVTGLARFTFSFKNAHELGLMQAAHQQIDILVRLTKCS